MNRNEFIKRALMASVGGLLLTEHLSSCRTKSTRTWPGQVLGPSASLAHKLFEGDLPTPVRTEKRSVVIVGAGISGLTAAKELVKNEQDVVILEVDDHAGGNSFWGQNAISKYPWGAHYLPIVNNENTNLISWLHDIGVITHFDQDGQPFYEESFLCHEKEERLRMFGKWIDGLSPQFGISAEELSDLRKFDTLMEEYRLKKGPDQLYWFDIPLRQSSSDPNSRLLDQLSFAEWMRQQGLISEPVHWYADYACRDDFGTSSEDTSAWMGLHYFCSRRAKSANAEAGEQLTWPEGNGFLMEKLKRDVKDHILLNHLVYQLNPQKDHIQVHVFDAHKNESFSIEAEAVVLACPMHVFKYFGEYMRAQSSILSSWMDYTPWAVANVSLSKRPDAGMAWDNVMYKGNSLGYVDACHQFTGFQKQETVITFYMPFSAGNGAEVRKELRAKSHADWCTLIVNELETMHPGMGEYITNIDVWQWGHPMLKMKPGFVFSKERQAFYDAIDKRIVFAHSDHSGISIFEEAFDRGQQSAKEVLNQLGI
jgi:hypothetical protein